MNLDVPDMSCVVDDWSTPYTFTNITPSTSYEFEDQDVKVDRTVMALIQPAQKRRLNPDLVDWSLKYVQIHSSAQIFKGETLVYKGTTFKVIEDGDYDEFGYTEGTGEEVRRSNG